MFKRFAVLLLPLAFAVDSSAAGTSFTVSSPDMPSGVVAKAQYAGPDWGGPGENVSPQIDWRGAPAAAKSFVVTMFDPDAPTGSGWWHWAVANIPANVSSLPRGAGNSRSALPANASEVNSDAGIPGYGGPLPASGKAHRYVITVSALNVERVELPPHATPALMSMIMSQHVIARTSFTAKGSR